MADAFASNAVGLESPASLHYAITPNNGADLPRRPRAIRAMTAGTVAIRDEAGTDITYTVDAGEVIPLRAVRILATGTTATVVGWE